MPLTSLILTVAAVGLGAGARLIARRRRSGAFGLAAAAVGLMGLGLGLPLGKVLDRADRLEPCVQLPLTTAEIEHNLLSTLFPNGAIQTAPPDDRTVCHDWTFGGTRYTDGCPVTTLLADYREVPKPRTGDIVVYWSPAGEPVHSGVVRAVGSEGLVVIESKWGHLGRYLHLTGISHFPTHFTYFRRAGDHRTQPASSVAATDSAGLTRPDAD